MVTLKRTELVAVFTNLTAFKAYFFRLHAVDYFWSLNISFLSALTSSCEFTAVILDNGNSCRNLADSAMMESISIPVVSIPEFAQLFSSACVLKIFPTTTCDPPVQNVYSWMA